MDLTDPIWNAIEGGYKTPYDASILLRQLEVTSDISQAYDIYAELWDELHHQGDVGLASYLSLPQLVRIGKLKGFYNWNILGLCSVIEQQRHLGNNPVLPQKFSHYYLNGLAELKQFVLSNINGDLDNLTFTYSLATLATCNGQIELGKAILQFEDEDILDEFIKQF